MGGSTGKNGEKHCAKWVSKMRLQGVQNGEARFAGVESGKREKREKYEPENTSRSSQSYQNSQTNCADRVSKMSLIGVQNGEGLEK